MREHAVTEYLGDVAVVHVRASLEDLAPLVTRPHHESVHGALDVVGRLRARAGTLLLTRLTLTVSVSSWRALPRR